MADDTGTNAVELATELTVAWLGNPNVRAQADDVPAFLRKMHETVISLQGGAADEAASAPEAEAAATFVPAVTVRKSLASKDHILSMIDGKPYKALRRHLGTHGLTPEQYRERYNLKADYPMVSESYSEARRAMAHKIGLGQKGRQAPAAVAPALPEKPKRAPRRKAVAPKV